MDTDSGANGTAPAPHGAVSSRASSALAAVSVLLILLYLIWRFIWLYRKHGTRRNDSTGATVSPTSSARPLPPSPSCPSRDATARRTTTTTSPLSVLVLVRVASARFGAEKADCAVCLAELGVGDGEAATLLVPGCGHGFHAECIEAWFRVNSTCPLCRAAVAAGDYDSSV